MPGVGGPPVQRRTRLTARQQCPRHAASSRGGRRTGCPLAFPGPVLWADALTSMWTQRAAAHTPQSTPRVSALLDVEATLGASHCTPVPSWEGGRVAPDGISRGA